jgi:integrase/recombinase XerD
MATVKPLLDNRYKSKDNTYPVIVRVRHGSQTPRDLPTGWKIEEKYWDEDKRMVRPKHPESAFINSKIADLENIAKAYIANCQLKDQPIKLDLIGKAKASYSFNAFLQHRASQYGAKDFFNMEAKTRRFDKELRVCFTAGLTFEQLNDDVLKKKPLRGLEIYFEDLNQDLLRQYETFLIKLPNTNNTRQRKFEFLGKFYQEAIRDGKAQPPNPFKEYKISSKPVKKEKLTEEEIKAIEDLRLKPGPLNDARNLFLFSYYCKGARFENCITAKRTDIVNDRVMFRTNKGNKYLSVKIHSRLRVIIDTYEGNFLFPYVKFIPPGKREYKKMIDCVNAVVNRYLKTIAEFAGITKNVSFHIARHSFAFHLKKKTNSIHTIKDALGHSRSATTEVYMEALDDEFLDTEMDKLYGE